MSRKKIILLVILVAVAIVGFYAYSEFNRTNKDLGRTRPDYTLTAVQLINEFEKSDSASSQKYNGRVLELTGNVKTVETDEKGYMTVVLGHPGNPSSVRCSMDSSYQARAASLTEGSSVKIRGACTGFNKDEMGLGSDVILNRCAVITDK